MVGNPAKEQVEVAKPRASFGPRAARDSDLPKPLGEWGAVPALQPCLGADTLIGAISFFRFFLSELRLVD